MRVSLVGSSLLSLLFILAVGIAPDCQRQNRQTPITPKECWAWIVQGEVGDNWPGGALLVAWTLRAWEVHLQMPADQAGRRWGWTGWSKPSWESIKAVEQVWERPLIEAPWSFIQMGGYCKRLGSAADVRLWQSTGAWGMPYLTINNPRYPQFSVNCYLGTKWDK